MQDFVFRTQARQFEYGNRTAEFAEAVAVARDYIVRCAPSAALFLAFCIAWAFVFGFALR